MAKLLVVVDMQNDFVDGALGSIQAQAIVPKVCEKIRTWDGDIVVTLDNHGEDYCQTLEGRFIPPHCIFGEDGWCINPKVSDALMLSGRMVSKLCKPAFGSELLANIVGNRKTESPWGEYDYIEFVGLCTDICVVSNALIARTYNPNARIAVDAECCAGTTIDGHHSALTVMRSCLIEVLNDTPYR